MSNSGVNIETLMNMSRITFMTLYHDYMNDYEKKQRQQEKDNFEKSLSAFNSQGF